MATKKAGKYVIPLTQGQFATVDPADYNYLSSFKWCALWNKGNASFYACRKSPRINGKQQTIRMHRDILGLLPGDSRVADHINRDTLDNTRSNLRIATCAENNRNSIKRVANVSGMKGVCWHKRAHRWHAQIQIAGKHIHLGYYDSPQLAHNAYCEAALIHHKEFNRVT